MPRMGKTARSPSEFDDGGKGQAFQDCRGGGSGVPKFFKFVYIVEVRKKHGISSLGGISSKL